MSVATKRSGKSSTLRAQRTMLRALELAGGIMEASDLRALLIQRHGYDERSATALCRSLTATGRITPLEDGPTLRYVLGGEMTRRSANGTRTALEARVFEAVGAGATAGQVEASSKVRHAALVLEGLVRRSVLQRRPGTSPVVYEVGP